MTAVPDQAGHLIITADDWGYSARYNAGIEQAARAGAVDAVSVMVDRAACDPTPLLECGVEVGLHLEPPESEGQRELLEAPQRQAEAFERAFGRPPAYIDGHHHCHAALPIATPAEDLALQLRVPLRAVGEDHRFRLEERGIASADRLVGRMHETEPALPRVLVEALEEETLPWGTTEWVVHPGHSDPESGSGYDRGREEDLALVLELARNETLAGARATHHVALGGTAA
ncbi:MAG: ChbG/HpnK family deacetylase [Solirubrobacterales bacterium]